MASATSERSSSERCSGPHRFYRARREFAVLASLSDHQLKDIGLTRTDLSDVTGLALTKTPRWCSNTGCGSAARIAAHTASAHETL